MQIPSERLSPEALDGLVEEFVTRDGTDYGLKEQTTEEKKRTVREPVQWPVPRDPCRPDEVSQRAHAGEGHRAEDRCCNATFHTSGTLPHATGG